MQVSVEKTGGLGRRLTVQIPGAEIQQQVDSRLQELSKQVKIKGFRPGKVPMSVVRQRYGRQVRQEVSSQAMQASLQQAIRDEQLRPATMPRVNEVNEDGPEGSLRFTAVLEVYPEVGALDLVSLAIERPRAEVTELDVDNMLQTLREQRRSWNPVDRTPAAGDHVLFEYAAVTATGRVPAEGYLKLAVVMGASGFEPMEAALAGLRAGEESRADILFPENFRESALAGKTAETMLKVTTVSEPRLPQIDADFIAGFGIADGSLEVLRREVRANLERELRQATSSILKLKIVEQLVRLQPELELPEGLVRQEASALAGRLASRAGREASPEEITAQLAPAAHRVRGGLLLGEVARIKQLRIDRARVRAAVETIAQTYEDPAEVVQLYHGNPQLMAQVENAVLEEQVVDWVLENATVTDKDMAFKDVIALASGAAR